MRRRLFHMYCALFSVLAWAVCSFGQNQADCISNCQSVEIPSKNLKQSRLLTISKPEGYEDGTDTYPVLYLLDGESNFEYTAPIVHYLADNERIPEMIVVGIHSGDAARRTRDLTPPYASILLQFRARLLNCSILLRIRNKLQRDDSPGQQWR